jgi:uncharacterized repeat protein (TIGR03803 family)
VKLFATLRGVRAAGLIALILGGYATSASAGILDMSLYQFSSPNSGIWENDGTASLVLASDGNYYGVSDSGSYGSIYRFTPPSSLANSSVTVLHTFNGTTDGQWPNGLMVGRDGKLYGTTHLGGSGGGGTVFSMTLSGAFSTLHSFAGGTDGYAPVGNLIQASDGYFYGVTGGGGYMAGDACGYLSTSQPAPYGCGILYRISSTGSETPVWSFQDMEPATGVTQGTDGYLYGTVAYFFVPPNQTYNDNGLVYRIATNGTGYQTLHTFTGDTNLQDGAYPIGNLIQGSDGAFYGTTQNGGSAHDGTVFRLTPGSAFAPGTFSILHSFSGTDGIAPSSGLMIGAGTLSGYMYGATLEGGTYNWGAVYSITTTGAFNSMYSFTEGTDGAIPVNNLVQISINCEQGLLGATHGGGTYGIGTLFDVYPYQMIRHCTR